MTSNWIPLPSGGLRVDQRYMVKYRFESLGYTIFLSDASRIWTESLDYAQILRRAKIEECSITPSEDDPNQLSILLEKLADVFHARHGATFTFDDLEAEKKISIIATSPLPKPLSPLTWFFNLAIGPANAMRKELVVPLLSLSYSQSERIDELLSELHEKDSAISRILDKFGSQNITLKSIFPTVPISRTSKKDITRNDLSQHVKGLRPFDDKRWQETIASSSQEVEYDTLIVGAFKTASSTNIFVEGFGDRSRDDANRRKPLRTQSTFEGFQRQSTPSPAAEMSNTKSVSQLKARAARLSQSYDLDDTTDDSDDLDALPKLPILQTSQRARTSQRLGTTSVSKHTSLEKTASPDATPSPSPRRTRLTVSSQARRSNSNPSFQEPTPSPTPTPRKQREPDIERRRVNHTPTPLPTPSSSTFTTPHKLGRIGGPMPSLEPSSSMAGVTSDVSATNPTFHSLSQVPATPRKRLGKIGGASQASQVPDQSQQARILVPQTPPSARKRGRSGQPLATVEEDEGYLGARVKREMEDDVDEEEKAAAEVVSSSSLQAKRETSQERADRKRGELKQELEAKARLGAAKKKRRF